MPALISPEQKLAFKRLIKDKCMALVLERINNTRSAMLNAQEAATNEERSTAGDKYEVGRAMGHLEQEMQSNQLEEANRDLALVGALNIEINGPQIETGTVVIGNNGIFFILIGLGAIAVNEEKVFVLSPVAPLAVLLMQKKAGDTFGFNKKQFSITDVF